MSTEVKQKILLKKKASTHTWEGDLVEWLQYQVGRNSMGEQAEQVNLAGVGNKSWGGAAQIGNEYPWAVWSRCQLWCAGVHAGVGDGKLKFTQGMRRSGDESKPVSKY